MTAMLRLRKHFLSSHLSTVDRVTLWMLVELFWACSFLQGDSDPGAETENIQTVLLYLLFWL